MPPSLKSFERELATKPLQPGELDSLRVRRWRARLRKKGFVVNPAGAYDSRLESATKVAQAWAGVTADGIVGPDTWRAVGAKARSKHPVSVVKAWAGRPKVIDARHGKAGFPRHAFKRWGKRVDGVIKAKLGHYTGGPASFIADAKFHVFASYLSPGGAPALAYTIGVDKDGTVFVFNDWSDVTWHCNGGRNTITLGIVFRGGAEGPTIAQRRSLKWVFAALEAGTFGFGFPRMPKVTTTHRHVNSTSCPGEKGEAFYRELAGANFRTRI